MPLIYKILAADEWERAAAAGVYEGSAVDRADGFIHFSSGEQVRETAARHFAGQHGLMLVAFDDGTLGPLLRYEPSRGGALFPHLYAPLDASLALWSEHMPLGDDGRHVFPDRLA